jgi:hypothetical protein
VARLDALDGDAEPQPPHREFGGIKEAVWTGGRHAIVGPDRLGQATLLEELLEGSDGKLVPGCDWLQRAGSSIMLKAPCREQLHRRQASHHDRPIASSE